MKSAAEVAEWLRAQIREGAFVPGQRLVEIDLSAATGATRSLVRAALQRLDADGLVSVEAYRGASVRRLSRREIQNLYLIREVLEGLAARLAAERGGDSAALATAQRTADEAVRVGDAQGFMVANQAWHAALLALADNPDLCSSLERLRVPILRLLSGTFRSRAVISAACESQLAVTTAVVARKPAEAEAAMRAHLRAGLAAMLTSLQAPAA